MAEHGLTRRQVLQGAAAIGAGAMLGSGVLERRSASAATLTYDVVVVGAGASGMTAALTAAKRGLSVLVIEKAAVFGGSAARSGSGIWIPNNSVILAAGVPDTPALAAEYLAAVVGSAVPADRQAAFLDNGPPMLDFVLNNTPLGFRWMEGYPDYYPERPGGMPNGRSIEPAMFNGKLLGSQLANLNPPYIAVPAGEVVYSADYKWIVLTVARFNGFAATGVDTDFGRGNSAYDHYYTDPSVSPNSCLAPLWLPPYYAFKIVPGDLGTKGGMVTDASARVLNSSGAVIPGLYAAGNASAAVMGHSYAGAGSTLGPAMTFGYVAANFIADSP